MSRDVSSFIKEHVKSHLTISKAVDEKYVVPMAKVWKEYDIGKQEIVLLGMAIGYKLEKEKKLKGVVDCEKALEKKSGVADLGNIKAFDETILTFLLGLSIAKYGVDDTISRFPEILNELEELAEKGVMYLYCNLFKKFTLIDKQLESILDIKTLLDET